MLASRCIEILEAKFWNFEPCFDGRRWIRIHRRQTVREAIELCPVVEWLEWLVDGLVEARHDAYCATFGQERRLIDNAPGMNGNDDWAAAVPCLRETPDEYRKRMNMDVILDDLTLLVNGKARA